LLHIEADQKSLSWQYQISSAEDFPRYYTASKLLEAGFIDAEGYGGIGESDVIEISALTFAGHQFLDDLRAPDAWSYVKAGASKLGNASVDVLMTLGKEYAKEQLRKYLAGGL
jgi:hypothetical protein